LPLAITLFTFFSSFREEDEELLAGLDGRVRERDDDDDDDERDDDEDDEDDEALLLRRPRKFCTLSADRRPRDGDGVVVRFF